MATRILALEDTIEVATAFVSGKDSISINGNKVFVGKMKPGSPQRVSAGSRQYVVERRNIASMSGATGINLEIHEGDDVIHAGLYDPDGKPVENEQRLKASQARFTFAVICGIVAFAAVQIFDAFANVLPSGIIAGGIIGVVVGLVGSSIGFGIALVIFSDK